MWLLLISGDGFLFRLVFLLLFCSLSFGAQLCGLFEGGFYLSLLFGVAGCGLCGLGSGIVCSLRCSSVLFALCLKGCCLGFSFGDLGLAFGRSLCYLLGGRCRFFLFRKVVELLYQ